MKVQVVNHMRRDIEVHKVGCADIAREQKRRQVNSTWVTEIPEGKTIVEAVVAELNDDFGWSPDDGEPAPWAVHNVRVLPCCKEAK